MWKAVEIGRNTFSLFNSDWVKHRVREEKALSVGTCKGNQKSPEPEDWALGAIFMYLLCSKNVPFLFKQFWGDLLMGYNLEQELLNNNS